MWKDADWDRIARRVDALRDEMIELQKGLCAIPALSPTVGGEGELDKARFLRGVIEGLAPDHLAEVHAPDPAAKGGIRPTLVAKWKGADSSRTIWFLTHTDVVPPGEAGLWQRSPWEAWVEDGRIIGRGVEDNQQSLVASVFALKACRLEGVAFPMDVGLMFLADEETGSKLGMEYVVENTPYFTARDLIVVPDGGSPDGAEIELAEKSAAWVEIRTLGKQCHASMPELGNNAFRAGSAMVVELAKLYDEFPLRDPLFSPPTSTFEPTRKEPNVPNINTIPGEDAFHVDCRILPQTPIRDVLAAMRRLADGVEQRYGVKVEIRASKTSDSAPPTPASAPVVDLYTRAIRKVYGVEARTVGIGGGTVAAFLRRKGLPAIVTGKNNFFAHQPNEACDLGNLVSEAKVFACAMGLAG